ncbi:MAG: NUDIX hydrolase [Aquihabitans sp.]
MNQPGPTAEPLSEPEVKAAGGAVWREASVPGEIEVFVVHRPRYGDWSLPKGKVDPGETELEAARREVQEETGFTCSAGPELVAVDYVDRKGRTKRVRYWMMQVSSGSFTVNDEVDEGRWVALGVARRLLSYPRDAVILDSLRAALPPFAPTPTT